MQKVITQTRLLTRTARLIRPMINLVGNGSLRVSEIDCVSDTLFTSPTKKRFSTATEFKFTQSLENKYNRIMLNGKSTIVRSCPPVKLDVYLSGKEGFTDSDGDKWIFSQENGGNMKNYGNWWVIDKDGVKAPVKTVAIPQNQLCDCDGTCSLKNCCGKGGVFNVVMITDRHGTYAMNITYDPIEAEKKSRILEAVWFDHSQAGKLLNMGFAHQKGSSTESPNKSISTSKMRNDDDNKQASHNLDDIFGIGIMVFYCVLPVVLFCLASDLKYRSRYFH
jgi:hypothetical protein